MANFLKLVRLDKRGDRNGMDVAVLRINRRKQSWEGDQTIKGVH
jgi:hypothetical protein